MQPFSTRSAVLAPPMPQANIASVYPQGTDDFFKNIAANLIRKLDDYLTSNIKQFNVLKDAIPLVKQAVELYMARDYNQSITQNFQVYLLITALRASTPGLPPL